MAVVTATVSCSSTYEPVYELWTPLDAAIGFSSVTGGSAGRGAPEQGGGGSQNMAGQSGQQGGAGGSDQPDPEVAGGGGSAGVGGAGGRGGGGGRDAGTSGFDAGSGRDAGSVVRVDAGSPTTGGGGCTLAVSLLTASAGGRYSPRNIGAIWITNSSGRFVKSLNVWARTRIGYLTQWSSVTAAAGLSRNNVDAVTGATLSSHQTHNVNWDCTDTTRTEVPDGAYVLNFEMTDQSGTGPRGSVQFTKGPNAAQVTGPDTANFKNISLRFTP